MSVSCVDCGSSPALPVLIALLVYLVIGYGEGKALGKRYAGPPQRVHQGGSAISLAPKLLPAGTPLFPPSGL